MEQASLRHFDKLEDINGNITRSLAGLETNAIARPEGDKIEECNGRSEDPAMKKYLVFLISLAFLIFPIASTAQLQSRPVLRMGSQGDAVRELQATLLLLGFYRGEVNGQYSESTVIAVSRFQEAANLPIDGIMGAETWSRLFPPSPSRQTNNTTPLPLINPTPSSESASETSLENLPILRSPMQGEAVKRLQERLRVLGIFSGEVDGIFGEQTLEAVRTFQQQNNLTVDGIVGAETWEMLFR